MFSFKHPSATELEHDFLWRTKQCLPERGRLERDDRELAPAMLISPPGKSFSRMVLLESLAFMFSDTSPFSTGVSRSIGESRFFDQY